MTPKLRDVRCSVCGAWVRQRKDGTARIHRSRLERCVIIGGAVIGLRMCAGSGMPAREVQRG